MNVLDGIHDKLPALFAGRGRAARIWGFAAIAGVIALRAVMAGTSAPAAAQTETPTPTPTPNYRYKVSISNDPDDNVAQPGKLSAVTYTGTSFRHEHEDAYIKFRPQIDLSVGYSESEIKPMWRVPDNKYFGAEFRGGSSNTKVGEGYWGLPWPGLHFNKRGADWLPDPSLFRNNERYTGYGGYMAERWTTVTYDTGLSDGPMTVSLLGPDSDDPDGYYIDPDQPSSVCIEILNPAAVRQGGECMGGG